MAEDLPKDLPIGMVKLDGCRCGRCWHEWIPRDKGVKPRNCAKCKNTYWDVPKKSDDQSEARNGKEEGAD